MLMYLFKNKLHMKQIVPNLYKSLSSVKHKYYILKNVGNRQTVDGSH